TEDETREARTKPDISVFPMATPLIAGPGTMGAVVLLSAEAGGDIKALGVVIGALLAVLALCFALLLVSSQVQRVLGVTGLNVLTRVVGVLLAALAVQFVFEGLEASSLF
ncbi:MAG: MarC family protein, partial [Rhodospirillaceae bacterium]|nr:MarC family protein [Rhodospirillaceae bacterium]